MMTSELVGFHEHQFDEHTKAALPSLYASLLWIVGLRRATSRNRSPCSAVWWKWLRLLCVNGAAAAIVVLCGVPEGGVFWVHGSKFVSEHLHVPDGGLYPDWNDSVLSVALFWLYWLTAGFALAFMLIGSALALSKEASKDAAGSDDGDFDDRHEWSAPGDDHSDDEVHGWSALLEADLLDLLCERLSQSQVNWTVSLHMAATVLAAFVPPAVMVVLNIQSHYPDSFSHMGAVYYLALVLFCVSGFWLSWVLFTALDILFLQAHLMKQAADQFATSRLDEYVSEGDFTEEATERLISDRFRLGMTMRDLAAVWKVPLSVSLLLFTIHVIIAVPTSLFLSNINALSSLLIVIPLLTLILWFIAFVVQGNESGKTRAVEIRGKLATTGQRVQCFDSFLLYIQNTSPLWDLWVNIDYAFMTAYLGVLVTILSVGAPCDGEFVHQDALLQCDLNMPLQLYRENM